MDNLTVKQIRLITFLLQSSNIKTACKSARVSRQTYYQWLKIKVFSDRLKQAESDLIETEQRALLGTMESCRMILYKIATSGESENQKRLSAIGLYELAINMRQQFNLEERIIALEVQNEPKK
jgi:hypothetical protein